MGRKRGMVAFRYRVSFGVMKFLQLNSGNGYTTLVYTKITELLTLKGKLYSM